MVGREEEENGDTTCLAVVADDMCVGTKVVLNVVPAECVKGCDTPARRVGHARVEKADTPIDRRFVTDDKTDNRAMTVMMKLYRG